MSYKTYKKLISKIEDKTKQLFKYKVVLKITSDNNTETLSISDFKSTLLIYKNDKIIKVIKENITEELINKYCKKYDTKIEYSLKGLTVRQLDFIIEYTETIDSLTKKNNPY